MARRSVAAWLTNETISAAVISRCTTPLTLVLVADMEEQKSLGTLLEAQIDRLIAMLDDIDGEEDLEDNGDDEPSFDTAQYSGAGAAAERR